MKVNQSGYDLFISIHAPRGGSDVAKNTHRAFMNYFNPRSPWGERPHWFSLHLNVSIFQSTLPGGGATKITQQNASVQLFQSTLPVGGATDS